MIAYSTEILERIKGLEIECPECEGMGDDEQYQCQTCEGQGGGGTINVYHYLTVGVHNVCPEWVDGKHVWINSKLGEFCASCGTRR